jgi:hypothetical protein
VREDEESTGDRSGDRGRSAEIRDSDLSPNDRKRRLLDQNDKPDPWPCPAGEERHAEEAQ